MWRLFKTILLILLLLYILFNLSAKTPVRIKDISSIQGIRENQLMGFGLITGLQGKGDTQNFKLTQKMLQNLASNHGFNLTSNETNSKNIASVLVTAKIGAFARKGDLIDITISSIGDAKSLEGGVLLQTPLKGADGNFYAVAQGRILSGNKTQGTENSASIPGGAIIEKDIISNFIINNKIGLILKYPDFITANQIKEAVLSINNNLELKITDPGLIEITLGQEEINNPIDFISKLEALTIIPDYVSMIVIDKKTGIIVMGEDIIIQKCTVSTSFAQVKVSNTNNMNNNQHNIEFAGQTVGELVKLLNNSGLTNNEIISIIESIHKIGAINAKLIIL